MIQVYQNEILSAIYACAKSADYSEKIAIQEAPGKAISYRQLVTAIEAVALALIEEGFERGDRALLLLRSNIDLMIIVLAVVRVGGVLVIADPAMGQEIFAERMALAEPKWVFAESIFLLLQKMDFLRYLLKQRGIEIPEINKMNIHHQVNVGDIPFLAKLSLNKLKKKALSSQIVEVPHDNQADMTIV